MIILILLQAFLKNKIMKQKLLTIVTPNLNGGEFLEDTIKSVLSQKTNNIEYIIVDGKSNDRSKFILKKYKKKIDKIIFQKDNSMYEAINRGFNIATGKYLTWINSDDIYFKNSLLRAVNLMSKKKLNWINGISSTLDKKKIKSVNFPYYFPRKYIKNGLCHKSNYGFIPQESVIFSKKLYLKSGGFNLRKKISGDYFLWKSFAKYENLKPVNIKIALFRKRKGQLSENLDNYYSELGFEYRRKKINFLRFLISLFYLLTKSKL